MPIKHEKFWFDDGNVILCANETLFRVHKGILAFQSTFFDGLFKMPTVPPPESSSESSPDYYEGIPVVRMMGDDAEDVDHLLQVLYNPWICDARKRLPLPVIISLLRLSTKYDFARIQAEVVDFLQSVFVPGPSLDAINFDEVCELLGEARRYPFGGDPEISGTLRLLGVVRRMGPPGDALAPILFYLGCMEELPVIFKYGYMYLTEEDLTKLVIGREYLQKQTALPHARLEGSSITVVDGSSAECPCSDDIRKLRWVEGLHVWPKKLDDKNPTYMQANLVICGSAIFPLEQEGLCEDCRGRLIDLYDERRYLTWVLLPSIFGLCKEEGIGLWYTRKTTAT